MGVKHMVSRWTKHYKLLKCGLTFFRLAFNKKNVEDVMESERFEQS